MSVEALAPLGMIGGTGWLGRALGRGFLSSGVLDHSDLILANRSGARTGYESHPEIPVLTDTAALVAQVETVLLAVPPAAFGGLDLDLRGKLVISIMAGASIARIAELTGAEAVVRSMPNLGAENGLCYTPWVASTAVGQAQRAAVQSLFESCGLADELRDEAQIDYFTALTGPVPGFVAHFADCMAAHAVACGVERRVAERAVKQLFQASGVAMAHSTKSPAEQVRVMIDYDGTTAAGLRAMLDTRLREDIAQGIEAAWDKARSDMTRG